MSSLASQDRLFFSSSPTQVISKPEQEVEVLVRNAQKLDHVDGDVASVVFNNTTSFFGGFLRRIELLKSRSQAFEDGHVTVYDKALLILTRNGNELNHPPAIAFYCEEFLGIPNRASSSYKKSILESSMIPHSARSQAPSPPETRAASFSTKASASLSPDKQDCMLSKENYDSAELAELAARLGPLATRVWAVCEKAKEDFFSIADPNSVEKQTAAKYLRDSAENVLQHVADKSPDPRLVSELEKILAIAKHTAMVLHGGKKRKFDDVLPTQDRLEIQYVATTYPGSRSQSACHQINGHSDGRHRQRPADPFAVHPPQHHHHAKSHFFKPELDEKHRGRSRKPKPRRGHSGIPYGYSRHVDSYHPAR